MRHGSGIPGNLALRRFFTALLQLLQRFLCGFLLGLLLALAFPLSEHLAANVDFGDKQFFVIRSGLGNNPVGWRHAKKHLTDFLKPRLVIVLAEFLSGHIPNEVAFHYAAGSLIAAVFIDSA